MGLTRLQETTSSLLLDVVMVDQAAPKACPTYASKGRKSVPALVSKSKILPYKHTLVKAHLARGSATLRSGVPSELSGPSTRTKNTWRGR